jgi:hypothetical protein
MAYVDRDYVGHVTPFRRPAIEQLELEQPGTFDAVATAISRIFDAKLAKRYATPFLVDVPEAIRWNVAQVVAAELFHAAGYSPGSEQVEIVEKKKADALTWLDSAANAKDGLVELPLREAPPDTSGVIKGIPLVSSEPSPYDWIDVQAEALRGR